MFFGDVDGEPLDRLVDLAVDVLDDDLRLPDGELEGFASHHFNEDRQLEFASALHLPSVGAFGREDSDRHVADQFLIQAVLQEAGGEVLAGLARERGGVDADGHRHARLIDMNQRQWFRVVRIGEGLADHDLGDACDRDDVARPGGFGGLAFEGFGLQQLGEFDVVHGAVALAPSDGLASPKFASDDAQQRQAAQIWGGVEVGDVCLQHRVLFVLRGRDVLEQGVEEWFEVFGIGHLSVGRLVQRGTACAGGSEHDREIEPVVRIVVDEVHEEVVDLVDDGGDTGIGPVDLVHDDDDRQLLAQRFAQDETGLGEGPFGGVDEHDDAVDHLECAFDLAAEIGVARGVDDVDRRFGAVGATVLDCRVLREDGDALLAFEIHRVHDAGFDVSVLSEGAGLPEHGVDESGLAMINVGNDCDVAKVFADGHVVVLLTSGPQRVYAPWEPSSTSRLTEHWAGHT